MINKIDFVILWVDGNDLSWQKERNKYAPKKIENGVNGNIRYRDWDNLKYWFRGVEKFAPWVNNIYFITWGHLPEWLNINHPKLKIVNHKDFIPKKYLPVFSSNPIILNLHRIKGLSEKFVFFNDDIFLLNDLTEEDFFRKNMPVDNYIEFNWNSADEEPVFAGMLKNNYDIANKYYNKRETILKNLFKVFNLKYGVMNNFRTLKMFITSKDIKGIHNNHIAQPFLKEYFYKLWELEKAKCDETSRNKFRTPNDITEYAIRYFQLLDGNFVPRSINFGKYFSAGENNSQLISYIENQKGKCICINDTDSNIDFEKCKEEINGALDKILNEKSTFEK